MEEKPAVVFGLEGPVSSGELRPSLMSFVQRRLRSLVEAEDIVQETYVRLYDYRRTRAVTNERSFCFAVARNLIRDHLRLARRSWSVSEVPETVPCPQPLVDEVLDYRQRVNVMVDVLRSMPPLRREIFLRNRLDEQPAGEITAELAMSRAAVDKHIARALADIRRALTRRGLAL